MKRITFFLSFTIGLSTVSFAQTSGPFAPVNFSTSGSGAGWANLSGVQTADNNPAYVDLAQYPACSSFLCYRSNVASFSGFGFAVPATASVTGVQLEILQRVSSPGGGIHDSVLTLAMNNVAMGNNKANSANWFDTPQTQTYGGASDTWGISLSPADVNDNAFGIRYEVTNTSYDQPASVDYLNMTIYYQVGTAVFSQNASPWFVDFTGANLVVKAQTSLTNGAYLKVYNSIGQLVYTHDYGQNNNLDASISAANWHDGIYIVQIENAHGLHFQKKLTLVK